MLEENLVFRKAAGTGELYIVRVHLVHHVAAQPFHQVGNGRQGQGDDGQQVHEGVAGVHVKGGWQAKGTANGLEQEDVGQRGHRDDEHNVERADFVHQTVLVPGHDNAQGYAQQIGQTGCQNADGEGVSHFRLAALQRDNAGVVIGEALFQHLGALPGVRHIGGGVQVIGAALFQTGGEHCGRQHIGALGDVHNLQHVHAGVNGIGQA